jgi:S-DNA-T family DNA segregation ATPase FtsK/SpoIIIE
MGVNIPSRIAFAVFSQTGSRTILDSSGAEKLLGRGDMLFMPAGSSRPTRVQGAFLSDDEVNRVVSHVISQQKANYQEEMMNLEAHVKKEEKQSAKDDLYEEVVAFVIQAQSASTSSLQRKFRIGYARASRLIDTLEADGVIGPYEGSKPRKVLLKDVKQKTS